MKLEPEASPRGAYSIDPKATLKLVVVDTLVYDPEGWTVEAQFNPKEVQIDQQAAWSPKPDGRGNVKLEFTKSGSNSMSFELFFDGFESGRSVQPQLDRLKRMLMPMGDTVDLKRPPKVAVVWGPRESRESTNLPKFVGVIESLSVKYTMFDQDGMVLRATANVKLKEAGLVEVGKENK